MLGDALILGRQDERGTWSGQAFWRDSRHCAPRQQSCIGKHDEDQGDTSPYAQRNQLKLTREQFAERVGCSVALLRKIEDGERRPSTQIAELIANSLNISESDRATFVRVARGELLFIVLTHPASIQDTRDYAEQLRSELEAQFTTQQIEAVQMRAQRRTLEAAVTEILSRSEFDG